MSQRSSWVRNGLLVPPSVTSVYTLSELNRSMTWYFTEYSKTDHKLCFSSSQVWRWDQQAHRVWEWLRPHQEGQHHDLLNYKSDTLTTFSFSIFIFFFVNVNVNQFFVLIKAFLGPRMSMRPTWIRLSWRPSLRVWQMRSTSSGRSMRRYGTKSAGWCCLSLYQSSHNMLMMFVGLSSPAFMVFLNICCLNSCAILRSTLAGRLSSVRWG